jgi:hypothetical protein
LKLPYDEPLSSFAFNSNLRRYTKEKHAEAADLAAVTAALAEAATAATAVKHAINVRAGASRVCINVRLFDQNR